MSVGFPGPAASIAFRQDALVRSLPDAMRNLRQGLSEFLAGADIEFWEHLAQVVFDGARAEEQPRSDLWVRLPIGGQACNLLLLGRQVVAGVGRALAHGLARGDQLAARTPGECLGADRAQHVVCETQLLAGVDAALFAP